jgi:putative endonuclease
MLASHLNEPKPFVPAKAGTQEPCVSFFVYIMASRRNGTLYIGMTDDLARRTWEHRIGVAPGFSRKYGVKILLWYEVHESRETAFQRERRMKKWNRAWKLEAIEKFNPDWRDLFDDLAP